MAAAVSTDTTQHSPIEDTQEYGGLRRRVGSWQAPQMLKQVRVDVAAMAEDVAAKASHFSDSIFGHMLTEEALLSSAVARRRAMMLVDVLVERHKEGRLRRRWIFAAGILTFAYLRYALPVYASWGVQHLENSMGSRIFAETVGGPYSQVNFGVLVFVTLMYFVMLSFSARMMQTRMPVKRIIFETLVVYNLTQMLLNSYIVVQLLRHALMQGFQYPWGNKFIYTMESHRLGYFIWLHYHCCQLELLDTVFVVLRKKEQKMTPLHVWLRLLNMWAWFFACRYACGGDAYFPAATNAATRAIVYAFYSLSLLTERGVPFCRKARITAVQVGQFSVCAVHALFCLYTFWNMQIPRFVLVLYFAIMLMGIVLYTDFHYQAVGKSVAPKKSGRKVSFAFDSSGWFYCYHFGVAHWLREHLLPEGLTPEDCGPEGKFPENLEFSGSSGGALVAGVLSLGLDPADVFELVLSKRHECRFNPFRMLPAVEDVVHKILPRHAWQCLTGRVRVVLSRVSLRYPFVTAEVVTNYNSNEDVFHALRATCHVPIIAGLGPYWHDGNAYFDGMFWPQMMVPWKGSQDDYKVRVSAFSIPLSDIRSQVLPTWWALFPPDEVILRGLFWSGYRDAGRWFAGSSSKGRDLCGCRKAVEAEGEVLEQSPSSNLEAARKLLLRQPAHTENPLPDIDPVTKRRPSEFVDACKEAIARDIARVMIALISGFTATVILLCRHMA
jgi:hypothetical protein